MDANGGSKLRKSLSTVPFRPQASWRTRYRPLSANHSRRLTWLPSVLPFLPRRAIYSSVERTITDGTAVSSSICGQ
jgi:hypothetical protein